MHARSFVRRCRWWPAHSAALKDIYLVEAFDASEGDRVRGPAAGGEAVRRGLMSRANRWNGLSLCEREDTCEIEKRRRRERVFW
jgi:hypothetical protein